MPKISMTGTRRINTLTKQQLTNFKDLMKEYRNKGYTHLNHGDCVGADALAHDIAIELGLKVIVHPPSNPKSRAYCNGENVLILAEREYKVRNQSLVKNGDVLLALPDSNQEYKRSGTWYSVRQARRTMLPIIICYPDGRVVRENIGGLFEDD